MSVRGFYFYFSVSFLTVLPACSFEVIAPPPEAARTVYAKFETTPVASQDDAADDPAIWVHPVEPEKSLVIGTDKQRGIGVYDLNGTRIQFIAAGRTNNVDLRELPDGGVWNSLAAASNRSQNTISLFLIDDSGQLNWLQDSEIDTGLTEVYGLCMYRDNEQLYVFVNDTNGSYQQWRLDIPAANNTDELTQIRAELVREFAVSSQPEGCVVDDANHRLFLGVEEEGIRVTSARESQPALMQTVMDIDNDILVADVEGMSIYQADIGGFLIVSSQGNYSYAVFDRLPPFGYRGSFVVADNPDGSIDGSEETDGLAVTHVPLGEGFPAGMLVVQDGANTLPRASQNFKYISWAEIVHALNL